MWIGCYKGVEWNTRYLHIGATAIDKALIIPGKFIPPSHPNGQTSTLQIGELFMHVSSSSMTGAWQSEHSFNIPGMLQLWPLLGGDIQWPSLSTINDRQALAIAKRLQNVAIENMKFIEAWQ